MTLWDDILKKFQEKQEEIKNSLANGAASEYLAVQSFLVELEKIYKALNSKQTKKIISEWTLRSSTIGKDVELNTINGKINGKAVKIDEDGALVITEGSKTHRVIAGDIIHLSK